MSMSEIGALKKIFRGNREKVRRTGENYIIRRFMICNVHKFTPVIK
jgi:hypothetical protein